ncbi:MAG: single-stranded DNA-binding protein [Rickettsia conorii subsp. raoultii]|uniref:Single-stranded DNA-binding protein n=1 Tax=Rickettsia conorii subsp. raoultii TaxID=369822 RepID=A0A9N7BAV6_RICCR|nr:single-stranded DNA-binding protein [Rickettsia conorii]AJQ52272.1 single-stranded DNA-binding protein [Rickettsia conorii subsp. raoultii]APZ30540.1 single-stranded DNA-binding protein [Rickettsia conorii subsp. raoultii]URW78375.1 single-stranded DNA-binding protein [Rickettsia conorii subsp. raoultii]
MAGSLNKVILIGNVGRDPEMRTTGEGKKIINLSLATTETWKDRITSERKERTEWHRVVIFSEGLVSVVERYVTKGSKLYIEGSLQTRKWNDNSGQEKYTTEVVLQNFNSQLILLDSKNSNNHTQDSGHNEYKHPETKNHSFDHSDLDDEIPF